MTGVAGSQGRGSAAGFGARWAAVLLAAAVCAPVGARSAVAQTDTAATASPAAGAVRPATPRGVRYGKWAAAALAVGATAAGIHAHNAGNSAYAELVGYCSQITTCRLASDGRYADPMAEATYQRVVRADRSARVWLVAGQVSAVGAAVLFVMELSHAGGPPNIPFAGLLVEAGLRQTRVGVRVGVGW